jgi:serine phosphatase RsbU (regulator of sigma subunit)
LLAQTVSVTPASHLSENTANAVKIALNRSAVPLYGPWKFTVGDSPIDPVTHRPLWAEPGFDDSKWETVDLTPGDGAKDPTFGFSGYAPGWTAKGHPGYWGYAWYRIRIQLNPQPGEKLAIAGPEDQDDSYELFADGTRLGSFGDFSGSRPTFYLCQPMMFQLPSGVISAPVATKFDPASANDGSKTVVLAFRFWMSRYSLRLIQDSGGIHIAPLVGDAGMVNAIYQSQWLNPVRLLAIVFVKGAVFLLLGLTAFSLIFFDRADRVYLWIGAVLLLTAAYDAIGIAGYFTQFLNLIAIYIIQDCFLDPTVTVCWVMVWWVWFGFRRPSWLPLASATLAVVYAFEQAVWHLWTDIFFNEPSHPVSVSFYAASLAIRIAFIGALLWIVAQGVRRKGIEGWLALPPVLLFGIANFSRELETLHLQVNWLLFGAGIGITDLADLLLALVLALLLLRRLLASLRRQRQMALDVKQAQEVQQVILPLAKIELPGFAIECEYRPALEVGGDFFQIVPHPTDGSVLIVAGDVAGKGLKAGMLVALLVGAIRSTMDWSTDPEAVLKALNQRLLGRSDAHATCLVLKIAEDGAVALANAGHLPPYLNGQPVPMEGALPLGLTQDPGFSVMHFKLAESDRLVILSDGVAEASDADGHLFGFERVLELLRTTTTAAEVAGAAQSFGQSDDISVIAVRRTAAMEAGPA